MSRRTAWMRQPPKHKQNRRIHRYRNININLRKDSSLQTSGRTITKYFSEHAIACTNTHNRNPVITFEKLPTKARRVFRTDKIPHNLVAASELVNATVFMNARRSNSSSNIVTPPFDHVQHEPSLQQQRQYTLKDSPASRRRQSTATWVSKIPQRLVICAKYQALRNLQHLQ